MRNISLQKAFYCSSIVFPFFVYDFISKAVSKNNLSFLSNIFCFYISRKIQKTFLKPYLLNRTY